MDDRGILGGTPISGNHHLVSGLWSHVNLHLVKLFLMREPGNIFLQNLVWVFCVFPSLDQFSHLVRRRLLDPFAWGIRHFVSEIPSSWTNCFGELYICIKATVFVLGHLFWTSSSQDLLVFFSIKFVPVVLRSWRLWKSAHTALAVKACLLGGKQLH